MTDVMSGIGLAQLKRYPEMLRRRREIIGLYNEGVKGTCIIPLNHYPDNDEERLRVVTCISADWRVKLLRNVMRLSSKWQSGALLAMYTISRCR